jgi:hypothetical protein
MIKKGIEKYPPYFYLKQLADHCPKAVSTYMTLWRSVDAEHKLSVLKKEIREQYLISLSKFRHDLLMLVKEGLVSIDETTDILNIELVSWDAEIEWDWDIC